MHQRHSWIAALSLLLLGNGCRYQEPSSPAAQSQLTVVVSVLPQRAFVEALGGARVTTQVLLPPGANHEQYEPTLSQLTALARARLWFQVAPQAFHVEEAWGEKVAAAAPRLRAVDTSVGVPIVGHDPHIWLSPSAVRLQIRTMAQVLADVDPAGRSEYEANLQIFLKKLDELDIELRQVLAPVRGRKLVIFHPAWGYFAREYGFELLPIEREGHEPGPAQLEQVIREARAAGCRDVFVEPQMSSRSASLVAETLGGKLVTIDPLAADWLENLRRVARTIAETR